MAVATSRRLNGPLLGWLGLAALLVNAAASAWSQNYTPAYLGTPASVTNAINNNGQVVGYFGGSSLGDFWAENHAFLYSGGTTVDLGTLPGFPAGSQATGVNDSGQVVGNSYTAFGATHAFLYSGKGMIDLGTVPSLQYQECGNYSYATAINNSGQVVGFVGCSGAGFPENRLEERPYDLNSGQAFLYSGGIMIGLGGFTGPYGFSAATAINNRGQIVGHSTTVGGTQHAFLYSDGAMADLGTLPGGSNSYATAINDSGQVVGYADVGPGEHAFLYSDGNMIDLGSLLPASYSGPAYSYATGINNSGEVVGYYYPYGPGYDFGDAFLYSGGSMIDPGAALGFYYGYATGINDVGQIAATVYTTSYLPPNGAYLLDPGTTSQTLQIVNPFFIYAVTQRTAGNLGTSSDDIQLMLQFSNPATSLAADGVSAVLLVYKSSSSQPVTFQLSEQYTLPAGAAYGSLAPFDPNYLVNPQPTSGALSLTLTRNTGPDASGLYTFLALLWGPNSMPVPSGPPALTLTVTASQGGAGNQQGSINLEPPPLLLVHGIWSSAKKAQFTPGSGGLYDYVAARYPHNFIYPVNYGYTVGSATPPVNLNSQAFNDPRLQLIFQWNLVDALEGAAVSGMAARTVDVVAHSMGGLITRYFMSYPPLIPNLLPNPIHKLITIGTPHLGSPLANVLMANLKNTVSQVYGNAAVTVLCDLALSVPCQLSDVMTFAVGKVSTGVMSLQQCATSSDCAVGLLNPLNPFSAIVGEAPVNPPSVIEYFLNDIIMAFDEGAGLGLVLGRPPNLTGTVAPDDTIVPVSSQNPGTPGQSGNCTAEITGVEHTTIFSNACVPVVGYCTGTAENASPAVWAQAFNWLAYPPQQCPSVSDVPELRPAAPRTTATPPAPDLVLSGYTQVPPSSATVTPASGSTLTINAGASITATSSNKTITELLLFQAIQDPADGLLGYATQSPFTVTFTPTRLGTAEFSAVTAFSDGTYAITPLTYTLQTSGTPYALNLVNMPPASMALSSSRVVETDALFTTGQVDVTQVATYTAASGTSNVFTVSSGGTITANGNGLDILSVTYDGVTATAPILVGPCTYSLNPSNQIVPYTGGAATIQVITQSGCAWTASGGASWLPFAQASGSGSGSITLTAAANSSGGNLGAIVYLAGLQAVVTQPAAACSYSLSQTQVTVSAAGGSGTIAATTACPVVASSNQTWLTATPLGSSVQYTVAPNNGTSQRSATLTIGTVAVSVTQSAPNPCDLRENGNIGVTDVQLIINEALGVTQPVNDLGGDGVVNVVDVEIELNAALSLGCSAK